MQGHAGRCEQPLRRLRGVVVNPIVIAVESGRDDLRVRDAVDTKQHARQQYFSIQAVDILVLEALDRVEDAAPQAAIAHLDHFLGCRVIGKVTRDTEAADGEAGAVADFQHVTAPFNKNYAGRRVAEAPL
jgi:hypothetical protein